MTGTRWERFAAKFIDLGGCWVWTGAVIGNGYGKFWSGERLMLAHRWAFETFHGPIPAGLEIDHLCRNRACVNPAHLEIVTHAENRHRGRASVCFRGHRYDEENTVTRSDGSRYCRLCGITRRASHREPVGA